MCLLRPEANSDPIKEKDTVHELPVKLIKGRLAGRWTGVQACWNPAQRSVRRVLAAGPAGFASSRGRQGDWTCLAPATRHQEGIGSWVPGAQGIPDVECWHLIPVSSQKLCRPTKQAGLSWQVTVS